MIKQKIALPIPISASRRSLLGGLLFSGMLAATPMLGGPAGASPAPVRRYSARTVEIMRHSLMIDMLLVPRLEGGAGAYARPLSISEIADFRASGVSAIHNAFGIGGPSAREDALTMLAAWQGFAGRHPDLFALVGSASDIDRARKDGRIAMIMGLQNAEQFLSADDVKLFHGLGLRCAQLTYNSQNLIGSGSTDRVDGGVSDFGTEIIKAMNAAGMLIDVSHSGDRTTLEAIELSSSPIAFTHSNCRALNDHPRNKSDEAIRKLAAKGGVMGITGVRNFIRDREPTNIAHLVDHIDHVVKLVGIDHVGIGSDADLYGYDDMPADQYAELKASYKSSYAFRDKIDTDGFDHPRKFYDLTEELIRRRYSDADIALILGGNFRRLLGVTLK